MAIIIPSKNIYQPKNPKIIDNVIDNVKLDTTIVEPFTEIETRVHTEVTEVYQNDLTKKTNSSNNKIDIEFATTTTGTVSGTDYYAGVYLDVSSYYMSLRVSIKKAQQNKLITKIFGGVKKENETETPYIRYIVKGAKKTTSISATYNILNQSLGDIVSGEQKTDSSQSLNLPKLPITIEQTNGILGATTKASLTSDITDESNLKNESIITESDEYFYINVYLLAQMTLSQMKSTASFGTLETDRTMTFDGTKEEYIAEQVEISFLGNTMGINLTDGSVTVPYYGGAKPHSLDGNELMQESNTIGNQNAIEYLANNILTQYKNGKETATLLCDIGEYYENNSFSTKAKSTKATKVEMPFTDENFSSGRIDALGTAYVKFTYPKQPFDFYIDYSYVLNGSTVRKTLKVNKNTTNVTDTLGNTDNVSGGIIVYEVYRAINMMFEKGDEVIPMVFGANGKDRPMSKKADGTPKEFRVYGNRVFYDGAVWQEISLQEI